MKAHPVLFDEEGEEEEPKNERLLFQFTVGIHFQNTLLLLYPPSRNGFSIREGGIKMICELN